MNILSSMMNNEKMMKSLAQNLFNYIFPKMYAMATDYKEKKGNDIALFISPDTVKNIVTVSVAEKSDEGLKILATGVYNVTQKSFDYTQLEKFLSTITNEKK